MPTYVFKCEDGHKTEARMPIKMFSEFYKYSGIFCSVCCMIAKNEIQPVNFYVNRIHDRVLPNGSFDTYDDRIPDMYSGAR